MMTDILCPTCGRPNPDELTSCDYCGSPLGTDGPSLRDNLLPPEDKSGTGNIQSLEPDESSRLDDFFKPEEPDDSSLRNDLLTPEYPDDQESLLSPEADESSRLDDLVQPTELEESSLRSDFFSADENNIWEPIQLTKPPPRMVSSRQKIPVPGIVSDQVSRRKHPNQMILIHLK